MYKNKKLKNKGSLGFDNACWSYQLFDRVQLNISLRCLGGTFSRNQIRERMYNLEKVKTGMSCWKRRFSWVFTKSMIVRFSRIEVFYGNFTCPLIAWHVSTSHMWHPHLSTFKKRMLVVVNVISFILIRVNYINRPCG
jgi:hypothetical protein